MGRAEPERNRPAPRDDRAIRRRRRSRGGKLILVLTIIVLVMLFAVQNADPARLRFLWFEFSPPLIWVIAAVGLAGALAGFVAGRPRSPDRSGRDHDGNGERRDRLDRG